MMRAAKPLKYHINHQYLSLAVALDSEDQKDLPGSEVAEGTTCENASSGQASKTEAETDAANKAPTAF